MGRDDLEHGWIVNGGKEDLGEVIGYCEDCGCEIRDYTYYEKICGYLLCENCYEEQSKREKNEN